MNTLGPVFAASLGGWRDCADALAAVAARAGVGLAALEASARGTATGWSGGRMMIERLPAQVARDLLAVLPVPLAAIDALLEVADTTPIIIGWDTARPVPVAKVYLNLSDAGFAVRRRVASQLGIADAPHVIGRNVAHDLVETKRYQQLDALPVDAPVQLRLWASEMPLAGVVQSSDVRPDGSMQVRAWFVAPRSDVDVGPHLRRLPGWQQAQFDQAIPFVWQQVRSVGFAQDGQSAVVYVKPTGRAPALWSLEPAVCIACPHGEVGVFVAPLPSAERAYVQTARHALSYRVRAGAPQADEIAVVMAWAAAVVAQREVGGASLDPAAHLGSAAAAPLPQGYHVTNR